MQRFASDFGEFVVHTARTTNGRPYDIIGRWYAKRYVIPINALENSPKKFYIFPKIMLYNWVNS